ncbi:MAG: hypothetical protein GY850_15330 [bacterium]|nr:hypothetical protein [bacterium]
MYTEIGSNLNLSGVNLPEIDLTGTQIAGELRLGWKLDADPKSSDGLYGWPKKLELNGLNYTRLVGFVAASEIIKTKGQTEWFIDRLNRDINYNQQSYEHLAAVLRKAGKDDMADDIVYAGRERGRAGAAGLRWWGLTLLNYLIGYGYGYRYFYSLLWVICLVALGVLVLRLTGEHRKHPIPLDVAYSLDMLLPIVQLRVFHYVKVDLSGPARHYFYFHKLMGYVLASFLIAGLSGLTR